MSQSSATSKLKSLMKARYQKALYCVVFTKSRATKLANYSIKSRLKEKGKRVNADVFELSRLH